MSIGAIPQRWACALISRYQMNGGGLRFFGVACNYNQTCSEYTRLAIEDQGVVRGTKAGWSRIRRCNHKGLATKLDDPYQQAT